jgi:thiosulfate/3-mercaptopyruvate sulfurtransferase
MTTPLISAPALRALMASGAPLLVFDCRFDLAQPEQGALSYLEGHLPGAQYLHLDRDLSAPRSSGPAWGGRHPLPSREVFAALMASRGCQDKLPVVAYDNSGGMYAARLWWMLRWLGHLPVQVLDGGLAAWVAAGGALRAGPAPAPARAPGCFTLREPLVRSIDYAALRATLGEGRRLVVDARAPDRFRGENETLDPIAGHIPGAANRFFRDNLQPDGLFKPATQLQAEWRALMAGRSPADLVAQCGSGVTACHNLLAMESAGLGGSALYAGSWSDWCAQPDAPVATGA